MKENLFKTIVNYKLTNHLVEIQKELMVSVQSEDVQKDIILVVRDQLDYVRHCIDSLYANTSNFKLWLWDNGSREDTKNYLESLTKLGNVFLHRSEANDGFIIPNNELAAQSTSPYIILLNTDTEVKKGWDKLLIGWLRDNPDVLETAYAGSQLNEECKGGPIHFGYDVDYLPGWCICFSRETYEKFGLFDSENLDFIYGEDADFSLRLKESGAKVYACYTDLVLHFENKTVLEVNLDQTFRKKFSETFEKNHEYLRKRYLGKGILLRERSL